MVQPLSSDAYLKTAIQVSQTGHTEGPGETEPDGDMDDRAEAAGTAAPAPGMLPEHAGTTIDIWA